MPDVSAPPTRSLPRISATIPISLIPQAAYSQESHDAYTVDVSPFGARIRTTFVLTAGQLVSVCAAGDLAQTYPCRVVWAKQSYAGGSVAGLEFLPTSRDADSAPKPVIEPEIETAPAP